MRLFRSRAERKARQQKIDNQFLAPDYDLLESRFGAGCHRKLIGLYRALAHNPTLASYGTHAGIEIQYFLPIDTVTLDMTALALERFLPFAVEAGMGHRLAVVADESEDRLIYWVEDHCTADQIEAYGETTIDDIVVDLRNAEQGGAGQPATRSESK